MNLVSVIIPVYNVEDYLDRCVLSVTNQTYQELEIILVDDGSPDRCPEMCDSWAEKDRRITVIHQNNGGLSVARNAGIRAAAGDYVLLLDSDDYIAPNTVELLLCAVRKTDSDMAICEFIKGSDAHYEFPSENTAPVECIDRETALNRIYTDDTNALRYGAACWKLCRSSLYDEIFYPEGKLFEDIYTTHKLLYGCKQIAVLDVPLFYYFQHPGSIMNTTFHIKKLDYLQALVERVQFFAAHNLKELEQIAYDELLHALIWEYSRTRDVLRSPEGMDYVLSLFRRVYKKGYASIRYPGETAWFLSVFNRNPEWIILYWRVHGITNRIFKRNR